MSSSIEPFRIAAGCSLSQGPSVEPFGPSMPRLGSTKLPNTKYRLVNPLPDDISGRSVIADKSVIAVTSCRTCAANLSGLPPYHLGVMSHIRPPASTADIRKDSIHKVLSFTGPEFDHLRKAESACRAHPDVFTAAAMAKLIG